MLPPSRNMRPESPRAAAPGCCRWLAGAQRQAAAGGHSFLNAGEISSLPIHLGWAYKEFRTKSNHLGLRDPGGVCASSMQAPARGGTLGCFPQVATEAPDPPEEPSRPQFRFRRGLIHIFAAGTAAVRSGEMQVYCKVSSQAAETHCSVCGQGFNLIWERPRKADRAHILQEVARTLRGHHRGHSGPGAHPTRAFLVLDGEGPEAFSGGAVPGHAPSWAL